VSGLTWKSRLGYAGSLCGVFRCGRGARGILSSFERFCELPPASPPQSASHPLARGVFTLDLSSGEMSPLGRGVPALISSPALMAALLSFTCVPAHSLASRTTTTQNAAARGPYILSTTP